MTFRFTIRTAMLIVFVICVLLVVRQQMINAQRRAVEYHFLALTHGYSAISQQLPADTKLSQSPFPGDISWRDKLMMDRKTLAMVRHRWQDSVDAAALRDYYYAASKNPFLFFKKRPTQNSLAPLPAADPDLKLWWIDELQDHVIFHGLNGTYGVSHDIGMLQRNATFVNLDYTDTSIDHDWDGIKEIAKRRTAAIDR